MRFTRLWLNRRVPSAHVTDEGWPRGHRLHIHNQIESRPGPIEADGASWLENRATGMVHLVCNCGYSSGWIPRREMPDHMQLKAEHGAPIESLVI